MMYQSTQLNPSQTQPLQTTGLLPPPPNHSLIQQHQLMHMNNVGNNYQSDLQINDIDKEKEKQARENHCEIERRRRVKMAAYFNELCLMVPTCNNLQRKPDKLTILRMASSHMRNLRQANSNNLNQSLNDSYKPSFLTDQELKHLILEAADGFLFVSQCDTGNIIYVSDAVQPVLSFMPTEWTNRSLFEFVHPDDLDKVKDQLSTQENSINSTPGRVLDLKTGTVKKEGHPSSMRSHIGSRRSFICRIRLGHSKQTNYMDSNGMNYPTSSGVWSSSSRANRNRNQLDTNEDKSTNSGYAVVHVTGYTKIWPPNSTNQSNNNQNLLDHGLYNHGYGQHHHGLMGGPHSLDDHQATNFHLIAIARLQMTSTPNDLVNNSSLEFVTRHDQNGLITFVDQRVTTILGYQPSDLLKKYLSDFSILQDQQLIKDQLKQIYETKQTQPIQFTINLHTNTAQQSSPNDGANSQNILTFKTSAYAFCNPCNEQFEFIVCTHTCQNRPHNNDMIQNNGLYAQNGLTSNGSMHDLSQYPYHNIQQQYPTHMPTQSTQAPTYAINSHMGSHLTQTQNTMYQTSPNLGNYLMMSNMNGHDMYSSPAQTTSAPSNSQTANSNLTMLHSVPNGSSTAAASQSWQTGSANF